MLSRDEPPPEPPRPLAVDPALASSSVPVPATPELAIALADELLESVHAKVVHGLLRYSARFRLGAVVAKGAEGRDAGVLLDGVERGVPVAPTLERALELCSEVPRWCIVGVATHGGRLTAKLRRQLVDAARSGLSLVNGLHDAAAADPDIARAAVEGGVRIVDLRRPPPVSALSFWSGASVSLKIPRVAVLGTDCTMGKRTTSRLLVEAAKAENLHAEMIYTGQTGWMQGSRFGFVLDSIPNDFVCGELERAILDCAREAAPEVMILEGQSALRNPCGPCGSELVLAGGARDVILQHAPGRRYFEGLDAFGMEIPSIDSEVELIRHYGAEVRAITLHQGGIEAAALEVERDRLRQRFGIPVLRPLSDGVGELVPVLREIVQRAGQ